jgi:hypothetical protein
MHHSDFDAHEELSRTALNCFLIQTNRRACYMWVDGYERKAGASFIRAAGEKIIAIIRSSRTEPLWPDCQPK